MNTSRIKPSVLALVPACLMFLLVQACGGSDNATAQEAADPIEGVWESAVTVKDCTSGATLANVRSAHVFHRGGTLNETNGSPTMTRGPGFGTWTRSGTTYTAKFRFFTHNPTTGLLTGTTRVVRTITMGADNNSATSVNTSQTFDLTGAQVASSCASDVSNRAP